MLVPQILVLQLDQELCRWDFNLIQCPHTRFKLFNSAKPLIKYTNDWLKITENEPGLIIISSHGMSGKLFTRSGIEPVEEFLDQLFPLKNKTVHFSACSTLRMSDRSLKRLVTRTDAHIMSGYQKIISSTESAQVESYLLGRIQCHNRL